MKDERFPVFVQELESVDFQPQQMRLAEAWILYGDWQYKGKDPVLEISDFFPSEEKIAPIVKTRNFILMTRDEIASLARREYDRGRTDGAVETREELGGSRGMDKEVSQRVMALYESNERVKEELGSELRARQSQCEKLQARLDGDDDPEKKERVTLLYEDLRCDYRGLAEEYWMLKDDADSFHRNANEFMIGLLNTKSASHAWKVLEEYRQLYEEGEALIDTRQSALDQSAYKMREGDRYQIHDKKKRRKTIEDKIDQYHKTLVVRPEREIS